ncbi:MAG: carboxypeptidase-like regulatory domain-containing protein [Halodesulfurarchaeum sp.]
MTPTRRQFVSTGIATAIGVTAVTGTATATNSVTLEGTIVSHEGDPVPQARIAVATDSLDYVRTDANGSFSTQVPSKTRVPLGFYKSSEDAFLAPRLDGVPNLHTLPSISVGDDDYDLGRYTLPEAYTLDARAVFAEKPGGVEDAIPRFTSIGGSGEFGSGYSYTTTTAEGYMKLVGADFTGVELAGSVRVLMHPPTYEPYTDQKNSDYAPYEKVDATSLTVTEDTTIECDISRRKEHATSNGPGR